MVKQAYAINMEDSEKVTMKNLVEGEEIPDNPPPLADHDEIDIEDEEVSVWWWISCGIWR